MASLIEVQNFSGDSGAHAERGILALTRTPLEFLCTASVVGPEPALLGKGKRRKSLERRSVSLNPHALKRKGVCSPGVS